MLLRDLNMMIQKDQIKYKVDDLVWAKIKGYAWWPATIGEITLEEDRETKYTVYFINDQTHSLLTDKYLCNFDQGFFANAHNVKRKNLIDSISHALRQLLELNYVDLFEVKNNNQSEEIDSIKSEIQSEDEQQNLTNNQQCNIEDNHQKRQKIDQSDIVQQQSKLKLNDHKFVNCLEEQKNNQHFKKYQKKSQNPEKYYFSQQSSTRVNNLRFQSYSKVDPYPISKYQRDNLLGKQIRRQSKNNCLLKVFRKPLHFKQNSLQKQNRKSSHQLVDSDQFEDALQNYYKSNQSHIEEDESCDQFRDYEQAEQESLSERQLNNSNRMRVGDLYETLSSISSYDKKYANSKSNQFKRSLGKSNIEKKRVQKRYMKQITFYEKNINQSGKTYRKVIETSLSSDKKSLSKSKHHQRMSQARNQYYYDKILSQKKQGLDLGKDMLLGRRNSLQIDQKIIQEQIFIDKSSDKPSIFEYSKIDDKELENLRIILTPNQHKEKNLDKIYNEEAIKTKNDKDFGIENIDLEFEKNQDGYQISQADNSKKAMSDILNTKINVDQSFMIQNQKQISKDDSVFINSCEIIQQNQQLRKRISENYLRDFKTQQQDNSIADLLQLSGQTISLLNSENVQNQDHKKLSIEGLTSKQKTFQQECLKIGSQLQESINKFISKRDTANWINKCQKLNKQISAMFYSSEQTIQGLLNSGVCRNLQFGLDFCQQFLDESKAVTEQNQSHEQLVNCIQGLKVSLEHLISKWKNYIFKVYFDEGNVENNKVLKKGVKVIVNKLKKPQKKISAQSILRPKPKQGYLVDRTETEQDQSVCSVSHLTNKDQENSMQGTIQENLSNDKNVMFQEPQQQGLIVRIPNAVQNLQRQGSENTVSAETHHSNQHDATKVNHEYSLQQLTPRNQLSEIASSEPQPQFQNLFSKISLPYNQTQAPILNQIYLNRNSNLQSQPIYFNPHMFAHPNFSSTNLFATQNTGTQQNQIMMPNTSQQITQYPNQLQNQTLQNNMNRISFNNTFVNKIPQWNSNLQQKK
eukprot:403356575